MSVKITASVGKGGTNNSVDVLAIQLLLNKWIEPKIAVTGTCTGKDDDATVIAIKKFQGYFMKNPDGLVGKDGTTLRKLNMEPFILLPQVSGYGYYSYGKGNWNERQWGTKDTVDALLEITRNFRWNNPDTLVAIGDLSFRFGGTMAPHGTHKDGIHIDLRPCRIDNAMSPVIYTDTVNYDQDKTKALIESFLAHQNVKSILFNDPVIYALDRVSKYSGHDNHFHVTMLK